MVLARAESPRLLPAPAPPAAPLESDTLRSRREFEYRLGHYLAMHPTSLRISREMCSASLRFLRSRARALNHSPDGRERSFFASLRRVLRPVKLPFAGRLCNVRQLLDVLYGEGNVRELQGTVWLVFSHVLTEDAAGSNALAALMDILGDAGLNPGAMRDWIASAVHHRGATHGQASVANLHPHEELFRMPWHPARRAQNETRIYFSDFHLQWRYWSLVTRHQFESEGGAFSRIERELRSALGPHRCPWLDVRRFTRPNEASALVQFARATDIPLENGISGVAVQSLQFARVLGVTDVEAVRIAAAGYLMSLKAHSLYEIIFAMQENASLPVMPLDYRGCLSVDWEQAARHCGPIPAVPPNMPCADGAPHGTTGACVPRLTATPLRNGRENPQ